MTQQGPAVTRTRPVVPSKLHIGEKCLLRYAYETERASLSIPAGVRAVSGTAVHSVIDLHSEGPVPTGSTIRDSFLSAVERELARPDVAPILRYVYEKHGVSGVYSREQIAAACQQARAILEGQSARHVRAAASRNPRPIRQPAFQHKGSLGSERAFVSRDLDLAGRIDYTYRSAGAPLNVTDYKTGKVTAPDGAPVHAFLLQIAAYGLVVKEAIGDTRILLHLRGPDTQWSAMLDQGLEDMVAVAVARIVDALPKGVPVAAETVANVQPHCSECNHRSHCMPFSSARKADIQNRFQTPFDANGKVLSATQDSTTARLTIQTGPERTAVINGIPLEIFGPLETALSVQAFSLKAYETVSRAILPANFYLYRPDNPQLSAFQSLLRLTR